MKLILICLLCLFITACSSPLNEPPPPSSGGQFIEPINSLTNQVNVAIEAIKIHRLPFDLLDGNSAQMQLFIFLSDGANLEHVLTYFGNGAVTVQPGSVRDNLGAGFIAFSPSQVHDEVYVWMLAVDIDDPTVPTDMMVSALQQGFGNRLDVWLAQRTAASRATLISFIANLAIDVAGSFINQEDLIGQQAFILSRNENWNTGRYELNSDDGAITIIYRIETQNNNTTNSNYILPTQTSNIRPTNTLAQRNLTSSNAVNGTINTARLNLRHTPSIDAPIVYRVSQYDRVLVLGKNTDASWVLIDAGVVGWVNISYIVVEGNISQLPLITTPAQYPSSTLQINYNCPGANGPSFSIGDRFRVPYGNGASGVFNEPGREPVLGRVQEGSGGYIRGGPVCAVAPQNRYLTWYYVETDNGLKGYMNESYAETPIKAIVPN